jgi:hypothetical protein
MNLRLTTDLFGPRPDGRAPNLEVLTESVPTDMDRETLVTALKAYAKERGVKPAAVVFIGGGPRAWSLTRLLKPLGFTSWAKPALGWTRPSPGVVADPWA